MNLTLKKEPVSEGTQLVYLAGELDIYSAPDFKEEMLSLMNEGCRNLIINLDNLKYIDSRGLGTFIGISRNIKEKEGSLALVCANATIIRTFQRTGLMEIFRVFETNNEALESLNLTPT